MASSDRFVAVGEEEMLYIISNMFEKPQVFYYLVSDAKIFDIIYQLSPLLEYDPTVFYYLVSDAKIFHIIYQLSPLLECDPTVTLLFSGRQTFGSHSKEGDNCIRSAEKWNYDVTNEVSNVIPVNSQHSRQKHV